MAKHLWTLQQTAYQVPEELQEKVKKHADVFLQRRDLGFLHLAERDQLWAESEARAAEIAKLHRRLHVVGMGGSSLGPRAFLSALGGGGVSEREVHFWDHIDPVHLSRSLEAFADDPGSHWVFVSKSGGTAETLAMANHLMQTSRREDLIENGITVIAGPHSNALRGWAEGHAVPTLEVPEDVGGRFSVFTPVGLLPLAFSQVNLNSVRGGLRGAASQLAGFTLPLCQQFLQSFEDQKWILAFWVYAESLKDFGLWFQQLWSESLAKSVDLEGKPAPRVSTPLVLRGASDQHSVLQQIMEGERDKLVAFLRVASVEDHGPVLEVDHFGVQKQLLRKRLGHLLAAEAQATETALRQAGVPCLRVEGKELNAESIALFMQSLMICVGILGEVLQIDAFNQPGVEAGKALAAQLLAKT